MRHCRAENAPMFTPTEQEPVYISDDPNTIS